MWRLAWIIGRVSGYCSFLTDSILVVLILLSRTQNFASPISLSLADRLLRSRTAASAHTLVSTKSLGHSSVLADGGRRVDELKPCVLP
ncbi:hypothetical protein DFH05DRAFT_1492772 [Lentinula detonsa]|nr:hypothetical protein DFH05DRAFT_1492772 [Lentinula detonsa]